MRKLSLAILALLALSAAGAAGARAEPPAGPVPLTPAELDAVTGGQSLTATATGIAIAPPAASGLAPNLAVANSNALAILVPVEVNVAPVEINVAPVDTAF